MRAPSESLRWKREKEEDILYNIYVITSVVKLIVHSPVGKLI